MKFKPFHILIMSLFVCLVLGVFSDVSHSQDGTTWNKYSTSGNPKTLGHNFTVQYPPSYEKISDFPKETYLQTFIVNDEEDSGDTDYYLAVGIHDLPDNIEPSALRTEGSWDYKKLEPFWTDLAKKEPGIKTMERAISWGNIPMAKFSVGEIQDEVTLLNAILYALHGDKLIKLECGLNIFNADPAFAERDYSKEQTCVSFFNSLQFLDYPLP